MQTIVEEFFFETQVKGSKFLAFLMPFKQYEKRLEELKTLHPKARHHIVCFRMLNSLNQVVEYATDDNEPKGCAGKPTLNVMRGSDLIECAVITVRYFGGTKLGTGGMVRAYSLAVKNVIEIADLLAFEIKSPCLIEGSYSQHSKITYFLEEHNIEIVTQQFLQEKVQIELRVTGKEYQLLLDYAKEHMIITIK